jgi:hypothetical protein
VRLMIHLEPAFSVTNEATMELVRISETAVSVSGTNMWRPHGYVPKSSRQYRELTVERRRVGDNLSRLVFASHPDNDLVRRGHNSTYTGGKLFCETFT